MPRKKTSFPRLSSRHPSMPGDRLYKLLNWAQASMRLVELNRQLAAGKMPQTAKTIANQMLDGDDALMVRRSDLEYLGPLLRGETNSGARLVQAVMVFNSDPPVDGETAFLSLHTVAGRLESGRTTPFLVTLLGLDGVGRPMYSASTDPELKRACLRIDLAMDHSLSAKGGRILTRPYSIADAMPFPRQSMKVENLRKFMSRILVAPDWRHNLGVQLPYEQKVKGITRRVLAGLEQREYDALARELISTYPNARDSLAAGAESLPPADRRAWECELREAWSRR